MSGFLGIMCAAFPRFSANLFDATVTIAGAGPITAEYAFYNVSPYTNGHVAVTDPGTFALVDGGEWTAAPQGNFDARATLVSGTTPTTGTLGSWINTNAAPGWQLVDSVNDATPVTCTLLIEISAAGAATVFDSCTVILSANRTS